MEISDFKNVFGKDFCKEVSLWLTTLLCSVALIYVSYLKFGTTKKIPVHCKNEEEILGIKDVPGPRPLFSEKFIGNLPDVLPFPESLKKGNLLIQRFPGMMKVYAANQVIVVLQSPQLIQQFLKSFDLGHAHKSPFVYNPMKPFITTGVLVSTGKFWQDQRKTLMKSQKVSNIKAGVPILNKYCKEFVKDLDAIFEDGKPHQINVHLGVLFLKIISEIITGSETTSNEELNQYYHNFEIWKQAVITKLAQPWLQINVIWRWHSTYKRNQQALKEMIDFAERRIEEHAALRRQAKVDEEVESENAIGFKSVLDDLVNDGVSHNQMVQELNTMIFGGHETAATSLHFFCFMMAHNPRFQQECQREIDTLFENPENFDNGSITFDTIQNCLKHTERCINETMRLYPPVFAFARNLETPMTVVHEGKKYLLPKGTNLVCCAYCLHRDAKIFPNPEIFDPDRFLPEEVTKRHPYAFIPFSGGLRGCLGIKFAMVEMKLVAAYILRHFDISCVDAVDEIRLMPYTTLTPERDYMFQFKRRNEIPT